MVSLPFKPQFEGGKALGISRTKAFRQFLRNEGPEFKSIYHSVLEEYESLGHMAEVAPDGEESRSFNLPHSVIKPEIYSTKVRVVFNASSIEGLSLIDTLYLGLILQNDLILLTILWRFYWYIFSGDIEKMYPQILLIGDYSMFQILVFRN